MANQIPLVWVGGRKAQLASGDTIAHTLISGLGTVVTYNTGTSGATVPLLNGTNTWSSGQTMSGGITTSNISMSGALIMGPQSVLGGADGYLWWDSTEDTFKSNYAGSARTIWHSGLILNIGTTAGTARTALALGTAATQNTGTSGANVPLLNGSNTHSGAVTTFSGQVLLTNAGSGTSLNAAVSNANIPATCTVNYTSYVTSLETVASAFTLGTMHHFLAQTPTIGAGSAVTSQFGFRAGNLTGAATNYGVYTQLSSVAGDAWNFYAQGAAPNYFNGEVRIGSVTDYGTYALQVTGDAYYTGGIVAGTAVTISSPTSFHSDPTLAATVTGNFASFRSSIASVAAAFNTAQVSHFNAQGWATGAGHTVTTQYAFRSANLDEATTNYAFHGSMASTSGNQWNCYMTGLAPNYFAGDVMIGDATDYGPPLQAGVTGSTLPTQSAATVAVFYRATSSGATSRVGIQAGNAASSVLDFGDSDDPDIGGIQYDHATETFTFRLNNVNSYTLTTAALTLPATPAAGTNNTVAATTAYAMSAAPNASYRNILDSSGSLTAAQTTGTYAMGQGSPLIKTLTGSLAPINLITIAAADYPTVNGLAAKLRIRAIVSCNDVAPGATFVIALHPVTRTSAGGGAGLVSYTVGAAVASSAATTVTTPAADSTTAVVGSDFALPADGNYAIGVVQSTASVAASAHVHFSAQLQMRNA